MALLKLAGIARSTYYYYQKRMKQLSKYENIIAEIKHIYAENQR